MGKTLNMKELMEMAVQKEMPLGVTEAIFKKLEYKKDENDDVLGAFVHFEGFRSIYLPFTDGEVNYQLDYLLEQLELATYNPYEINDAASKTVKISRYIKENEKTISAAEYQEILEKYAGEPPTYIQILEEFNDGSATIKSTFTNTNFNLKTIK